MTPIDDRTAEPQGDIDVDLIDYLLSLTPAERIKRQLDALELVNALRKAGREYHGFDPRTPPAPR